MLYVEFTHSQSFETFVRCHQHAFEALGGVARECWYDNLLTVVAEHDGRLIRFNPRFLAFAREYGYYPRAWNPRAAWEKGKIEAGIGYLRLNFWPLRSFTDLADVNRQARLWLKEIANVRMHRKLASAPAIVFVLTVCGPCRCWLPIIATRRRSRCIKACAGISMPTTTVPRHASSASA
jgi:transposase